MEKKEIIRMDAAELSEAVKCRKLSVAEAVKAYLLQIEEQDHKLGCYLSVWKETAVKRAAEVQKRLEKGEYENSHFVGVPVAVKDNICTKGMETTCASRMLKGFRPPYDAYVIERLEAAGAVILGKTNMDEFAMGSTTETSAFFPAKNPWNPAHVPGGSSGGSAAAVAAGEAVCALGSDTGGSVRQPASFCGVMGMKPTYGTVSRYGLIAYASSLDQIGVLTRGARDCAALMELTAGHDVRDSTSLPQSYRYLAGLQEGIAGCKIGLPDEFFGEGLNQEVRERLFTAAAELEKRGAVVKKCKMPALKQAVPAYYVIADAEASSNLSRYDGVRCGYHAENCGSLEELYRRTRTEGFGAEVKRRIMTGAFVLSSGYYEAYYEKAQKVRRLVKQEFDRAFENFDLLLAPAAPSTAPKLGTSLQDPLSMYLADLYTAAVNLAGLPAASIPCGADGSGLPIGLQLIGKPFGEEMILRAAYQQEQAGIGFQAAVNRASERM